MILIPNNIILKVKGKIYKFAGTDSLIFFEGGGGGWEFV
jgi:hypothetical protein